MKGFEKISLTDAKNVKNPNLESTQRVRKTTKFRLLRSKRLLIPLGIIIVLIVFVVVGIVLPAKKTYSAAKKTQAQAKLLLGSVKKQNIELASDELVTTKQDLAETQADLNAMSYLKFIPLANLYYNDADHLLKAGTAGLNSAGIVIDSLKPYEDVLGLKGQGSFSMGSAEDRIKTAVMTMDKITPNIDTIATSLDSVQKEIDAVDPNHYPKFIFGDKVSTQLSEIRTVTDEAVTFTSEARPLIKVLPSLLGSEQPKRYLILFQNDKELRPTGGFITGYSIFRLDKGVISVEKSEDIYTLDDSISNKPAAPVEVVKYLSNVYNLNIRDSNLSPDFVESMKTFQSLYSKSSEKTDIDGIIAIDTNVLVSTIKILDDQVTADGLTFTTKEDSRCNCPQVIYTLEDNISRPVNYIKTERKSLLGSLLYSILQKSLSSSPKIYWGPLFQSLLMETNQKHVLFDLNDVDAQSGIEALNAAGRIDQKFDGDYLHINDANFGGAKSNLFVKQNVEDDYTVNSDKTITRTLTITYTNPQAPSDCSLERGGLCLNAVLRDWVRIYVPNGSQLTSSKGSIEKVTTTTDLGKTVFTGFVTVRPQGSSIYTLTYTLPFKLSSGSTLPVLIQKQPGTDGNNYTVKVNGHTQETFQLYNDKKITLKF